MFWLSLQDRIGDLNKVKQAVKILVYVASDDDFYEQPYVANGGSQLLVDLFGEEAGAPTRSAVGMNVLPGIFRWRQRLFSKSKNRSQGYRRGWKRYIWMRAGQMKRGVRDLVSKMTLEEKVSQLRYDAPAVKRLGIPSYNWWNEALHGVARAGAATVFPQAIGLAAMFDEALLEKIGDVTALEGTGKI